MLILSRLVRRSLTVIPLRFFSGGIIKLLNKSARIACKLKRGRIKLYRIEPAILLGIISAGTVIASLSVYRYGRQRRL